MTVVSLTPLEPIPEWAASPIAPLAEAERGRHAPDRHLLVVEDGRLVARASCWWQATPTLPGERVGLIGHYASANAAAGRALLDAASLALSQAGCTIAIGPMDGTTWRRYRWVVERGSEPPFFLEPDNPDSAPAEFAAAGFAIHTTYTSTLTDDLAIEDARVPGAEQRLGSRGVHIRSLDISRSGAELRAIYALSVESFSGNYLYTPIDEAEFLDQNERALPYVDPDLVLMAEDEGRLVGYLFGIPDMLQKMRGEAISTIIVKTVAVAGGRRYSGLGSVLVALAHRRARARGYTRAIHALMHERNVSRNISRRYARTIRRYALFARRLEPAP
jgi:L-amino acid N-acyltransferase YncA